MNRTRAPRPAAGRIAYYSMEVALRDRLPTFSGGLGVLAGDHLRAAADRGLPMVAVTLLYNQGFFRQSVADGRQQESPVEWRPADELEPLRARVALDLGGRRLVVRAWRFVVRGVGGHGVPVHFLDTDLDDNAPDDRVITDRLYTSDQVQRLGQEAVLGLGGPLMLQALGYDRLHVHHVNEGHGALVPLCLLAQGSSDGGSLGETLEHAEPDEIEAVRERCVFTTHTPVPAGHDQFPAEVVRRVLGEPVADGLGRLGCLDLDGGLNMTVLAIRFAGFVNAVSLGHREVTRTMFPCQPVEAITNGVHTVTWAAPATAALFDRHLPGWRADSTLLRYASAVPLGELRSAHDANKADLCNEVRRRTGVTLRPDVLTIGVARRFALYKRNDLVLHDPRRLVEIADESGPLQVVFAGKAHPGDEPAKEMVRRVIAATAGSGRGVTVVFVEDYGMDLARLLCAGSDVWLNNPTPPNEASGTSGMKAALNGVPSVSTLDGWWLEGWIEGVTGWAIGRAGPSEHAAAADPGDDAERLYELLEDVVAPAYYKDSDALVAVGRGAISLNGSFFSAHRMVDDYARRAYKVAPGAA